MKYTRLLLFLFCGLLAAKEACAQSWQWGRGNTNADVDGWPVATDKSGNIFIAGIKSGLASAIFGGKTIPVGTGVANYQCVIAKYDPTGNCQWARGTLSGNANLIGIATDNNGNVYMLGAFDTGIIKIGSYTLSNPHHKFEYIYFLAKYDAVGNVLWARADGNAQFYFPTVGNISNTLGAGAIATDGAGYVYITCNFHLPTTTVGTFTLTNTDPAGLSDDIMVAKYDPSGNVIWAKSYGGSKSDDAYALTVTQSGSIYVAGDMGSPTMTFGTSTITNAATGVNKTAFIARFDGDGNGVWAQSSGGNGDDYAGGLACDRSDNVYLVGGFKENQISFAGTTIANPVNGKACLYLCKFNPSNTMDWYKIISSTNGGEAWGHAVATSSCGSVWVCGAMSLDVPDSVGNRIPCNVDVDGNTVSTPAVSYDPILVAGFTSSGAYVGASALQSGGDDQTGIACDPSGNVFLCGDYVCKSPFTIAGQTFPGDAIASEMTYLGKYVPPNYSPHNPAHSFKVLCYMSGITLDAPSGYGTYIWSDGLTMPSRPITDTGIYWVRGDDTCGIYMLDTFIVRTRCDCGRYFFVPNSFTPNGDGQNDVFYPRSSHGETRITYFRIYNRWGELLFEREHFLANDATKAWDGTFGGNLPMPDVYVYVVEAVCEDGTVLDKKGSVTVIR